jgi:hypothetical protein
MDEVLVSKRLTEAGVVGRNWLLAKIDKVDANRGAVPSGESVGSARDVDSDLIDL